MIRGYAWLMCWIACLGCHSLSPPEDGPDAAESLWRQGQEAMALGEPDKAIACYQSSLALDGERTRNHLSLAAAHLECGREAEACTHLGHYLDSQPGQVAMRGKYAELLWRLGKMAAAHTQFTRFVTDVQEVNMPDVRMLVHAHGRLLELAEEDNDEYAVHLHRGLGLYFLACGRAELPDPDGEFSTEGLLCKSAAELVLAHEAQPEEARPCWYLYEIWHKLAQVQTAGGWLRKAEAASRFSQLTPTEERRLLLALRAKALVAPGNPRYD